MGFTEQEEAGMQPDPEFKAFFAKEWKRLMEAVEVPGMRYASWDRKAAYLLWCMGSHYTTDTGLDDWMAVLEGHVIPDPEPAPAQPIDWAKVTAVPCAICQGVGGHASSCPNGPRAAPTSMGWAGWPDIKKPVPLVGSTNPALRMPLVPIVGNGQSVNPVEDAACPPSPKGIPLAFDSAKW